MSTYPWVVSTKARPRLRLFCLPYAGGGASIFRLWANKLPQEIEVCPIFLPGRERRMSEAPFSRLGPMIEMLGRELSPLLDVPFAFFGHSMGALISFELIRYLRKNQQPAPVHLFASSFRGPQLPDRNSTLHTLADNEVIDMLRDIGGTSQSILQHSELMDMLLPLLRADFELCETYEYIPEPPLDCPITAFGGTQDQMVSVQELEAWRIQTRGEFTIKLFAGDHFFLNSQQDALLRAVGRGLASLLVP